MKKNKCRPIAKWHVELGVKHMTGFHYQRYFTSKFTQIEPFGLLRLGKCSKVPSKTKDVAHLKEMLPMAVYNSVR